MQNRVYELKISGDFSSNRNTAMIFDENMEKVFLADPIGLHIIKLINGDRSVSDIIEELCSVYECDDPNIIINDVCEYIELLVEKGICVQKK